MKAGLILMTALCVAWYANGQTPINKTIPVQAGQHVVMHFDYPELIRVSTWDKNEIGIQGSVSINGGENDDAFELLTSTSGNTISIRNEIKDLKNLPHRITIKDGGQTITFKSQAEYKKYQQEQGRGSFDMVTNGVDMDILIEIKVPRNCKTNVESVYGMVEIKNFTGPLTVVATYGGVDAALTEKAAGEIAAETNFGEIYTNLDAKFGGQRTDEDFHTFVTAKPGNGPQYSFESKYGNVYIRKEN
ncbi:MAG TPA: hypothetical protein VK666_25880 [Chryseolinea sp.]|nr:hypothetical protein [Chryseolinea sp.]